MAEKIFVEGLRTFKPRAGAPEFALGSLIITPEDLVAWIKANKSHLTEYEGKKQLRLNMTKSRDGGVVISVDTYRKEEAKEDLPF